MTRHWRLLMAGPSVAALLLAACNDDGPDGAGGEIEPRSTAASSTSAGSATATTFDAGSAPTTATETTAPAPETDWQMLGRDLGNSRAAVESTIGRRNVAELEPVWDLNGINGLTGTPVVADGVVYVGDWTGHVRAVDAASGDELWATDIGTNYVGGSVAIDESRVYIGTFEAELVALDRQTGEELWTTDVDRHPMAAIFGSPLVADDLVVMGVASYEVFFPGDPPTFRGQVAAVDTQSGDVVWRYYTTTGDKKEGVGVPVWASPAIDTDRRQVYVGTGQHYRRPTSGRSDSLLALDLDTGKAVWVRQFTAGDVWTLPEIGQPDAGPDSDIGAPANLFDVAGTAAVGAGDKAGVYKALDRDTGEVLWSTKLTEGGLQGGVMASAAVAGGRIFVSSNKGSAAADLLALDTATGKVLWRTDVGAQMTSPVSWANGVVYLTENSGRIVAYDAENGDELWSHRVDAPASSGVAVVDGTVYAGFGWWLTAAPPNPKGGLIAFRLRDAGVAGTTAPQTSVQTTGQEIYRQTCAVCHGNDGEGVSGPALTNVEERMSAEQQVEIVRDGRGQMPSWGDSLSGQEIEAVVEYVRTGLSD